MAPLPAARFIPEFGAEPRKPVFPMPAKTLAFEEPRFEPVSVKTVLDKDDAYDRGFAAGKAEALKELEKRLEEQRDYHNQQLTLERFTWGKRESDKLAAQIGDGLKEIEARISGIVARILRPFIAEAIHRQAISELTSALEALLGANEGVTLEISGPEDLLQLLREKLRDRNITVLYKPGKDMDVRIVVGQTVLETCLGTWMRKVEEHVE